MAQPPELVWLDNLTPKSTRFDDTYYSREDGLEETRYVFLDGNHLPERWEKGECAVIGEMGFGTGLNFLATWQAWQQSNSAPKPFHEDNLQASRKPEPTAKSLDEDNTSPPKQLHFISVEKYPMDWSSLKAALSPWPDLSPFAALLIEAWQPDQTGWQQHTFGDVTLHLFIGDATDALTHWPLPTDAWYLDGFNPKTNPDLWSLELMQAVHVASTSDATLASYTAAGWVRRNLQVAGFTIEKRKGFGHKRDMITGTKMQPTLKP